MPKAKAFYADKLGLKVTTDYRQDDDNWWVSLNLPEAGAPMSLPTAHENMKPGTMKIYFATSNVAATHKVLSENFSMFVRNFLPKYSQPDADAIENLSMSIMVDQKRMGGGSHSTVEHAFWWGMPAHQTCQ